MRTILYYTGLIKFIRKAHLKISLAVLHKQVLNYRKVVQHSTDLDEEIRSSIERLLQEAVLNVNGQSNKKDSTDCEFLVNGRNHSVYAQNISRKELSELAIHFKERNNKFIFNNIEEKLEKSTIDHVHEAIRHARQGDEQNAHMHADIASSSCEELSHFMSKERHQELVCQMKGGLEKFKADM